MSRISELFLQWSRMSLVLRILVGLIIGAVFGLLLPGWTWIGIAGTLFVSALKAIAPVLVAVLVAASIAKAHGGLGASGVAGGSLLLIPMACSFLGIGNGIAMQAVAVGFIIGVIQDSVETALNSSGDVFFAATAELADRRKKKQ